VAAAEEAPAAAGMSPSHRSRCHPGRSGLPAQEAAEAVAVEVAAPAMRLPHAS